VEWLKVKALNSNLSTAKKKNIYIYNRTWFILFSREAIATVSSNGCAMPLKLPSKHSLLCPQIAAPASHHHREPLLGMGSDHSGDPQQT
jgi:hypothetical protein